MANVMKCIIPTAIQRNFLLILRLHFCWLHAYFGGIFFWNNKKNVFVICITSSRKMLRHCRWELNLNCVFFMFSWNFLSRLLKILIKLINFRVIKQIKLFLSSMKPWKCCDKRAKAQKMFIIPDKRDLKKFFFNFDGQLSVGLIFKGFSDFFSRK